MKDEPARVVVEDAEHANLLALLMRTLIERNLADDRMWRRYRNMEGDVEVRAADMSVTMRFGPERLAIVTGPSPHPRARVRGTMASMLAVVTGGDLLGPLLDGFIRIGGNPFVLLKILPLIRAREETSP